MWRQPDRIQYAADGEKDHILGAIDPLPEEVVKQIDFGKMAVHTADGAMHIMAPGGILGLHDVADSTEFRAF